MNCITVPRTPFGQGADQDGGQFTTIVKFDASAYDSIHETESLPKCKGRLVDVNGFDAFVTGAPNARVIGPSLSRPDQILFRTQLSSILAIKRLGHIGTKGDLTGDMCQAHNTSYRISARWRKLTAGRFQAWLSNPLKPETF